MLKATINFLFLQHFFKPPEGVAGSPNKKHKSCNFLKELCNTINRFR